MTDKVIDIDHLSYALNQGTHAATASGSHIQFDFFRSVFPVDGVVFTLTALGTRPSPLALPVHRICIPASVKHLSPFCFSHSKPLQFVTFESLSSLRQIGECAFLRCSSLIAISLPDSIETIGHHSFDSCETLQSISIGSEFGGSLSGRGLFAGCGSLVTIRIPGSVEELRQETFQGCRSLRFVVFEKCSRLRLIGKSVFLHCLRLRAICLPASLERIDGLAFQNTPLQSIECEGGDCRFRIFRGFLIDSSGDIAVASLRATSEIVIPSKIAVIGIRCFAERSRLSSLTFEAPCGVRVIGKEACLSCSELKSILIPASVEVISRRAFAQCRLSVVNFQPDCCLRRIEESAFACCPLNSFWVPPLVEFIDGSAFYGTAVTAMTIDLTASRFAIDGDFLIDPSTTSLVSYFGTSTQPLISSRFSRLGSGCFCSRRGIISVTFESGCSISEFGDHAFQLCDNLQSIVVPNSTENLGKSCFRGSGVLATVSFQRDSHLRQVGPSAFRDCTSLEGICLPASVEILSARCFEGCSGLQRIMFETGSALRRIESRVFSSCVCLSSIILAGTIETLSCDWYEGSSIRKVTFESGDWVKGQIERGIDLFQVWSRMEIEVRVGEDEDVDVDVKEIEGDVKLAEGGIVLVRGDCNQFLNEGAFGTPDE
jgi:hypothetical protein